MHSINNKDSSCLGHHMKLHNVFWKILPSSCFDPSEPENIFMSLSLPTLLKLVYDV